MRILAIVIGWAFFPGFVLLAQTNQTPSAATAASTPAIAAKTDPIPCRECGRKGTLPCQAPGCNKGQKTGPGKTTIPCPRCKGTGILTCWACGGTKVVKPGPFVDDSGYVDPAITLKALQLVPRPLPFTFIGVSSNETGTVYIVFTEDSKVGTVPVKLQDPIPSARWTEYRVIRYAEKFQEVPLPGVIESDGKPAVKKLDFSELTIQKGEDPAMTLVRGRRTDFTDRYLAQVTNTFECLSYHVEAGMRIPIFTNQYNVVRVGRAPDQATEVVLKRLDSGKEFKLLPVTTDK